MLLRAWLANRKHLMSSTNKRNAAELAQFAYAQRLGGEATQFGSGAMARLTDLADLTDEKYFAGGRANADAQQAVAGQPKEFTSSGILGAGIKRGGALARIGMMTGKDVDMQALRDRVSLARFGQGIRSGQTQDLQSIQRAQDMTHSAQEQAGAIRQSGTMNFLGTAAGALGRWGQNYFEGRKQDQAALMGTMSAFGTDRV
jgi:hypothetical protein